jgi:hypothetical protein
MAHKAPRSLPPSPPPRSKPPCIHLDTVEVRTTDGELVAQLCLACDTQLDAGGLDEHARAAHALLAAGFSAKNVFEMTCGQPAERCGARLDVTGMSDATPQYLHGCYGAEGSGS